MKTIYVAFLIMLSVAGLSVFTGRAVPQPVQKNTFLENSLPASVYSFLPEREIPVNPSDLSRFVRSSVIGKYAAYVIDEAFWGNDGLYKLVLKKEKAKMTVYCNETGELIKKEPVKWDLTVVLK